jgi:phage terminase large subunit-like protein
MFMPLPEVSHVIVTVDTALSEKDTADWSACIVWGVWHRPKLVTTVGRDDPLDDGEQPRVVMMGGWRRRCRLNDPDQDPEDGMPRGLVQRVDATARRFQADRIIIENKTRGLDVKNELERQLQDRPYSIELFEPKRHGDKVARLNAVQPLFNQQLVYAPAWVRVVAQPEGGVKVSVNEYQWVRDVIKEVEAVPRGIHDDYADCVSMGLITLREGGYLDLTHEHIRYRMAIRPPRRGPNKIAQHYGV